MKGKRCILWFQIEELVRVLRYERKFSMTVDALNNTWSIQAEKLKGFRKREKYTGTQIRGFYDILSSIYMHLIATIKLSDYQE